MHTGKVFAATPATTGIKPFMNLIGQVMSRPEYDALATSWFTLRREIPNRLAMGPLAQRPGASW